MHWLKSKALWTLMAALATGIANAAGEGFRMVVAAPLLAEQPADATPAANRLADAAMLVGADATRLGWATPMEPADATLPPEILAERLNRLTDGRLRGWFPRKRTIPPPVLHDGKCNFI